LVLKPISKHLSSREIYFPLKNILREINFPTT
jgi:hypothetical protein